MTRSSDAPYKTANLTLASFLAHKDQRFKLVRTEGRMATWEFDGSQVVGLVAQFERGEAQVEPQSFHHSLTKTRRTLFDFINGDDPEWDEEKTQQHSPSRRSREGAS